MAAIAPSPLGLLGGGIPLAPAYDPSVWVCITAPSRPPLSHIRGPSPCEPLRVQAAGFTPTTRFAISPDGTFGTFEGDLPKGFLERDRVKAEAFLSEHFTTFLEATTVKIQAWYRRARSPRECAPPPASRPPAPSPRPSEAAASTAEARARVDALTLTLTLTLTLPPHPHPTP